MGSVVRLMAAVLNQLGMEAAWLDARAFLRAERAAAAGG